MIRLTMVLTACLGGILAGAASAGDLISGSPLELKTGDRVVLVGSALIERDGESGYLETRVALRYPGQSIVWRNLGWSGDTVEGITRGKPNPPTDGFVKLVEHVAALKPTVIILGYGANEAFGGSAGLPAFGVALDRLWTELAKTGAKLVVLTPTRQEKLGPPLPDPTAHNADLKLYRDLLWVEATRRGAVGVDLFNAPPNERPWTTNEIHLSPSGYWSASALVAPALTGTPTGPWRVTIDNGKVTQTTGANITGLTPTSVGLKFQLGADLLPDPPFPLVHDDWVVPQSPSRLLQITGLPAGIYWLEVDGKRIWGGNELAWQSGGIMTHDADEDQVEALRATINRKNLLYFHRWRPQNETYLFGFRKHEQGKNAAEMAAFDPLIAAAEVEIARLSQPVPHTYELIRVGDESQVKP